MTKLRESCVFPLRLRVNTLSTSVHSKTGGRGVLWLQSTRGEGAPGSHNQKCSARWSGGAQWPQGWRQAAGGQQLLCWWHDSPWGKMSLGHDYTYKRTDVMLTQNDCVCLFMNQVARKIKLSGNQLCLLVLDGKEYEQAVSHGQDLRGLASTRRGDGCKPPRLCHITRDPVSGLGLSFTPVEGNSSPGSHKFCIRSWPGGHLVEVVP